MAVWYFPLLPSGQSLIELTLCSESGIGPRKRLCPLLESRQSGSYCWQHCENDIAIFAVDAVELLPDSGLQASVKEKKCANASKSRENR